MGTENEEVSRPAVHKNRLKAGRIVRILKDMEHYDITVEDLKEVQRSDKEKLTVIREVQKNKVAHAEHLKKAQEARRAQAKERRDVK